jgi:hypothetical protein
MVPVGLLATCCCNGPHKLCEACCSEQGSSLVHLSSAIQISTLHCSCRCSMKLGICTVARCTTQPVCVSGVECGCSCFVWLSSHSELVGPAQVATASLQPSWSLGCSPSWSLACQAATRARACSVTGGLWSAHVPAAVGLLGAGDPSVMGMAGCISAASVAGLRWLADSVATPPAVVLAAPGGSLPCSWLCGTRQSHHGGSCNIAVRRMCF